MDIWGNWESVFANTDKTSIEPFFCLDFESEDAVLGWLKNALNISQQENAELNRYRQAMQLAYHGFFDPWFIERSDTMRVTESAFTGKSTNYKPKRLAVNHLRDLVEQVISRITSLPIVIQPFPASDSITSKNDSLIVKSVLETINYQSRFKTYLPKIVRNMLLMGEGFVSPYWNANRGLEDPAYKEAAEKGERIPRKDENGEPLKDEDGNVLYITDPVYMGDVDYRYPNPQNIFVNPHFYSNTPEWFFEVQFVHKDRIEHKYPKFKGRIRSVEELGFFDMSSFDYQKLKDYTLLVDFYHVSNEYLPKGKHIRFTPDLIIFQKDSQYPKQVDSEFGDMPLERLVGYEIVDKLFGIPITSDIAQLQHVYNQMTTIIRRNLYIASGGKWIAMKGSVNRDALTNSPGILEYSGGVPPRYEVFTALPPEAFAFRNDIKQEMEQLSGVFGVSRGDPPPNTRSAEQLSFYEEQQQQRASGPLGKYAEFIMAKEKKTLAIISKFYDKDDKRLRMMMGEGEEPLLRPYDISVISQPWNLRLKAVSATSTSPTVMINRLLQVRQQFPELMTAEQFADLTQFGQVDKVYTSARAAINAAEAENQYLAEGEEIDEAKPYQEQIIHWKEHIKAMQSKSYESWPEKQKTRMEEHVMGHEYLMVELMQKNPGFAQDMLTLKGFPAFFVMEGQSAPPAQPIAPLNELLGTPPPPPNGEAPNQELQIPGAAASGQQLQQ